MNARWNLAALGFALSSSAFSGNAFTDALINGRGESELQVTPGLQKFAAELQQVLGSSKPLIVRAALVNRFASQSRCGRIAFSVETAEGRTFKGLGGHLNVCEDGLPPLQECEGSTALVPPGHMCANGKSAKFTQEVQDAIRASIKAGDATSDQLEKFNPRKAPK